ncbi:hypothetical protein, partial [Mesorhizobium japonicum]|uniref:hypothetical protein n=1 Tax=Mesorhizobium japonicum TaxID=2066070 RepID=UPI003B59C405
MMVILGGNGRGYPILEIKDEQWRPAKVRILDEANPAGGQEGPRNGKHNIRPQKKITKPKKKKKK